MNTGFMAIKIFSKVFDLLTFCNSQIYTTVKSQIQHRQSKMLYFSTFVWYVKYHAKGLQTGIKTYFYSTLFLYTRFYAKIYHRKNTGYICHVIYVVLYQKYTSIVSHPHSKMPSFITDV